MFEYYKNWMEFWFFVLIAIGVLLALSLKSAVVIYIITLIAGFLAGKIVYERKHNIKFPFYVIATGFVIGYLIGVYYGNRWIVIVLFMVGAFSSYKLYDKKILRDTRF